MPTELSLDPAFRQYARTVAEELIRRGSPHNQDDYMGPGVPEAVLLLEMLDASEPPTPSGIETFIADDMARKTAKLWADGITARSWHEAGGYSRVADGLPNFPSLVEFADEHGSNPTIIENRVPGRPAPADAYWWRNYKP